MSTVAEKSVLIQMAILLKMKMKLLNAVDEIWMTKTEI